VRIDWPPEAVAFGKGVIANGSALCTDPIHGGWGVGPVYMLPRVAVSLFAVLLDTVIVVVRVRVGDGLVARVGAAWETEAVEVTREDMPGRMVEGLCAYDETVFKATTVA
jgi:hypothetical protein